MTNNQQKETARAFAWAAVQAATNMGEKDFHLEFEAAWKVAKAKTTKESIADAIVSAAAFNLVSAFGYGHYEARFEKASGTEPMKYYLDAAGKKEVMFRYGAKAIHAQVVHDGDLFEYAPAEENPITHKMRVFDFDPKRLIGVYAFARVGDSIVHVFVGAEKLAKIKSMGRGGVWSQWPAEMYEKTAYIQLFKKFPKSAIPAALLATMQNGDDLDFSAPAKPASRPASSLLEDFAALPSQDALPSPDALPMPAEGWDDAQDAQDAPEESAPF